MSSGASNSCSTPSGPTSFTLCTAVAEATNLPESRGPGARAACLAKPTEGGALAAGAAVRRLAPHLGTDNLGAVAVDILLGPVITVDYWRESA